MTPQLTITSYAIHRPGINPVFGEGVTHVSLADEAAGFFIEVQQIAGNGEQCLRLDADELDMLVVAGKKLLNQAGARGE